MSLTDYPLEFLACRAWGHRWETKGAFVESLDGVRMIVQRWRCGCGCAARDTFTPRFVRAGQRHYTRPDGYSPTPTTLDARAEWFRRNPPGR